MTDVKEEKKRVPLRQGLFKIPEDPAKEPYLIASKCKKCGEHFVPTRFICLNCGSEDMEETALGGRGKVVTYTTVMQQVPGSLINAPYGLVIVNMDEDCQVYTVVTDGYESIKTGMPVEVYFEKIDNDAEGNERIAYKFRAVK